MGQDGSRETSYDGNVAVWGKDAKACTIVLVKKRVGDTLETRAAPVNE